MKLQVVTVFSALLAVTSAHDVRIHRQHAKVVRQDAGALAVSGSSSVASPGGTSQTASASPTVTSGANTAGISLPPQPTGDISIPPLSAITSGMPTAATFPVTATYTPGALPSYSGALPLPSTSFVYNPTEWPTPDKPAPTDSPQVKEWLKEIEGVDIPDIPVTVDGACAQTPANVAKSAEYGWWTCSGTTRDTDIVSCPTKYDWGTTFDDGPAPYTPTLLKFLDEKKIKSTFFIVGSRAVERPQILIEEYMSGHEIGCHTWAHSPMTSLTNEQVVAELGWSREAIRRILGVTPRFWRPPYGDVDDRVRAIATAMGLTTSIWTATPTGGKFDTNDWQVAGGNENGIQQYSNFQNILGNASVLDTGFIVLQHDLFEITVDLAVGYTINSALTHNPPFTGFQLKPVGECNGIAMRDMYAETTTNQTFLDQRKAAQAGQGSSSNSSSSGNSTGSGNTSTSKSAGFAVSAPAFGALGAAALALLI
ncbi:carbohydrate esterase family 4 protein [Irpex lacteus]|nr:carbohydrate esterase family 4 protein [Irpex lacteus]